jgi:hypothetical protein
MIPPSSFEWRRFRGPYAFAFPKRSTLGYDGSAETFCFSGVVCAWCDADIHHCETDTESFVFLWRNVDAIGICIRTNVCFWRALIRIRTNVLRRCYVDTLDDTYANPNAFSWCGCSRSASRRSRGSKL